MSALRPTEPTARVICPECHQDREVSARQARRVQSGEVLNGGICRLCACRHDLTPEEKHKRFWLDRFPLDEIMIMAWAIADAAPHREPTTQ